MHCPNCNANVTEDQRFCTSCGTQLAAPAAAETVVMEPTRGATPTPTPEPAPTYAAPAPAVAPAPAAAAAAAAAPAPAAAATAAATTAEPSFFEANRTALIIGAVVIAVTLIGAILLVMSNVGQSGSTAYADNYTYTTKTTPKLKDTGKIYFYGNTDDTADSADSPYRTAANNKGWHLLHNYLVTIEPISAKPSWGTCQFTVANQPYLDLSTVKKSGTDLPNGTYNVIIQDDQGGTKDVTIEIDNDEGAEQVVYTDEPLDPNADNEEAANSGEANTGNNGASSNASTESKTPAASTKATGKDAKDTISAAGIQEFKDASYIGDRINLSTELTVTNTEEFNKHLTQLPYKNVSKFIIVDANTVYMVGVSGTAPTAVELRKGTLDGAAETVLANDVENGTTFAYADGTIYYSNMTSDNKFNLVALNVETGESSVLASNVNVMDFGDGKALCSAYSKNGQVYTLFDLEKGTSIDLPVSHGDTYKGIICDGDVYLQFDKSSSGDAGVVAVYDEDGKEEGTVSLLTDGAKSAKNTRFLLSKVDGDEAVASVGWSSSYKSNDGGTQIVALDETDAPKVLFTGDFFVDGSASLYGILGRDDNTLYCSLIDPTATSTNNTKLVALDVKSGVATALGVCWTS